MNKHCFICKRTINCADDCLMCAVKQIDETKKAYENVCDRLREENFQLRQDKLALERKIASLEQSTLFAIRDVFRNKSAK